MNHLDLRSLTYYVITLPESVERKASIESQMLKHGLSFEWVYGVKMPAGSGIVGCGLGHMRALQKGLESGCPFVILEDDISFDEDVSFQVDVPQDAASLYIGVSLAYIDTLPHMRMRQGLSGRRVNENLFRVLDMLSGHGIVYMSEVLVRVLIDRLAQLVNDWSIICDICFAHAQWYFPAYCMCKPLVYQDVRFGGVESCTKVQLSNCGQTLGRALDWDQVIEPPSPSKHITVIMQWDIASHQLLHHLELLACQLPLIIIHPPEMDITLLSQVRNYLAPECMVLFLSHDDTMDVPPPYVVVKTHMGRRDWYNCPQPMRLDRLLLKNYP